MNKIKIILSSILLSLILNGGIAQEKYEFTDVVRIDATEVKNQQITGTCWSFSAASYIESEAINNDMPKLDLSEMFVVRNIYIDKALNYVRRQGTTQFGEGALGNDFLQAAEKYGLVPEWIYPAREEDETYDHRELSLLLKSYLDGVIKNPAKKLSKQWLDGYKGILDAYMGEAPEEFEFDGKIYTPLSFAKEVVKFDINDYLYLTSFTHEPYYKPFVLQVPDNFSSASYYNVPLNELTNAINYALDQGFTLEWDADVSEKGFSGSKGIAIVPEKEWGEKTKEEKDSTLVLTENELEISEELRQEQYENYLTTDDHLMHIIGYANDQDGKLYYIVKNSWGNNRGYDGFVYVSSSYMKLKTISIIVNKEGVSKDLKKKLEL
ncbi:MAG: aminopeptidase [Bacteroidetes bacterium]|nr:MAG: aminopeptidase [Bacteroidota bacterium]